MVDMSEVGDGAKDSSHTNWARWIGVYIGMLAAVWSIATMIGKNAEEAAAKALHMVRESPEKYLTPFLCSTETLTVEQQ